MCLHLAHYDAHKPARRVAFGKRVWRTAVLHAIEYGINEQGSLFGLRVFRKARHRPFTVNVERIGNPELKAATIL